MNDHQPNPLNGEFWVDAEYGGHQIQDKAALALTAAYGALGVAHLIERSIAEMQLAHHTEHDYAGLKPTLLENILCAQHVLLKIVSKNVEDLCEFHRGEKIMAIKKTEAGWLVDIQPGGRGSKRYRKTLDSKGEALAYEAWLTTKINIAPEWSPAKRDLRKLSDLVEIWYQHHGVNLRAGEDTFSRLKTLCTALGNPFLDRFNGSMFAEYRKQRTLAGIAPNTLNREHAYLRSVLNEAKRLGHLKGENPLSSIRQIKVPERELSYLSKTDIKRLMESLKTSKSEDTALIAKVCLSTGARWSEAEQLKPSQVRDGQIHFINTKSGKNRSVPIRMELQEELEKQNVKCGEMGRLFRYSYNAFREGVKRAQLVLPEGQLTHILRHTFASHFMMNGGEHLGITTTLGAQQPDNDDTVFPFIARSSTGSKR